jgi:hypothetical protein
VNACCVVTGGARANGARPLVENENDWPLAGVASLTIVIDPSFVSV